MEKSTNNYNALTLIDYLEKHAFENPKNIAYVCKEMTITYKSLLEKVNGFAGYLLEQGVKEGDIVGVCLSRSIEMIISLLAIIKIRAAYLPIDEKYPPKRIIYMLNHARVKYLVTDDKNSINLNLSSIKKINFTNNYVLKGIFKEKRSDCRAYVIYTSGSTGVPKGVQIGNTSLINVLQSIVETLNVSMSDTILAVTTISFDIAALEIFVCLLVGAKCVIASDFEKKDGTLLNTVFIKYHVSIMQATPTHFKLLIQTGWHGSKNVRLLCGGEPLDSMTAQALLERSKELWNMYGPTETTIWSTMTKILSPEMISIGNPIANTVIYICTEDMQQANYNQVGEMYIGGIGVSWGYLYDKERTIEKFIKSPFQEYKGILFRTGDLVKKTRNGEILFLGRQDTQVKHKGYRIELGEIDNLLSIIPGVEYIATILEENNSYTWLHCLVKTDQDIEIMKKKILKAAKCELPYYMWPDKISFLKTLPLTDNGKIDRNLLKNVEQRNKYLCKITNVSEQKINSTGELYRNSCNYIVNKIVSKIYGGQVTEQDNLINLGFDSLKMAELVATLRLNGYDVDFGIFETCSTISEIEQYIKNRYVEKKDGTIVEQGIMISEMNDRIITRRLNKLQIDKKIKYLFPTTSCQHCMIQYALLYKGSKAYNQAIVHKICGPLDVEKCKDALSNLIRKCDLFNSIYLAGNGTSYRAIIDTVSFEMLIEFVNLSTNNIQETIKSSLNMNYDLGKYPSFLLKIVHVIEDEYFFIWSYHHVLFDGYSIEKIIELFWQLYKCACLREKTVVSIKTTNQYIYWVEQQITSSEARNFWMENTKLLMISEANKIKRRIRPTLNTVDAQSELLWTINEELVAVFMERLESIHVLPHAGIKAAWAIVLHKVMKKHIVSFGNVLSGRSSCIPEHKDSIGVMINIVPICVDFSNSLSFKEFLVEMQKKHVMVMKYEYFPLDAIGWPTNKLYDALDCIVIYNPPSLLVDNINNHILASLNLRMSDKKVYDIINCKVSLTFSYARQLQIQALYNNKFYAEQEIKNMMHLFETILLNINNDIDSII